MNHPIRDLTQPVSVIIPVYNGQQFLAEAIESVLAQTYHSYELIIVDDGSTDRTREIALSYPAVKYVYQANSGTASARNRGIQTAQSDLLAFLDADDLWMPDKLSLQIKAIESDTALEIVTGYIEQFVSPELDPLAAQRFSFHNTPLPGYSPTAILIKRSVINKIGPFHEDRARGEAISWFIDVLEKKPNILILPDVVARRRIHGKNVSIIDQDHKDREIIRILKNAIDRKRAGK
jgi:glycosyltransferase involved in cell wall biosynthesis